MYRLGVYTIPTIISYFKVLPDITTHIFAIGGDSFNHYARLIESKKILLDSEKSIFHWPGLFFPDGLTAFDGPPTIINDSIHLILSPIMSCPLIYNLIHLSTYILAGTFCYILVYELSKNKLKSYFVGFIYAFSHLHYFAAHLWLNITHIELVPLVVFLYIRLNKKEFSKTIAISLCLILTILGYESLYFYFMLALFLFFFFVVPGVKTRTIPRNLSPLIVSTAALLFWLIPMLKDPTVEKEFYSPHIFYNPDTLKMLVPDIGMIRNNFRENPVFIGLPLFTLAVISILKKLNQARVNRAFLFLIVLSFGSMIKFNGDLLPIATPEVLLTFIPAYKGLRSTDRYLMFLMIPIGMMAYNTIAALIKNKKAQYTILLILIAMQIQLTPHKINVKAPKIYSDIPEAPDESFGLLEFPINNPKYWMWRADHGYDIVHGYLFIRGRKDKLFHELHRDIIAGKKLNLEYLKGKGVKYIVSHTGNKENLYASFFGKSERENRTYTGPENYLNNKDLARLELISSDNNSLLYKIK